MLEAFYFSLDRACVWYVLRRENRFFANSAAACDMDSLARRTSLMLTIHWLSLVRCRTYYE